MRSATRSVATALRPVTRRSPALRHDGRALTIIGWHRVDGEVSDDLSTGVRDFAAHLDAVEAWGGVVLPLPEAVSRLYAGTLPARAVALTFDDGYASVVETAWPMLQRRGWPATLFVVTDSLTRELTFAWDDHAREPGSARFRLATSDEIAKAAADGLDVGSHTCTHPLLPRLDDEALRHELRASRAALGDLLGREVTSIAYPTGAWDRRVRAATREAGYRTGITVDRGRATARSAPLSLPRAFVPHDVADLELLLDGAYTYLRPLDVLRRKGRTS